MDRSSKHVRLVTALVLALCLGAATSQAAIETYSASLSGANEVPPNASTATGSATLSVDNVTLMATYHVEFTGLSSPQTAAHFHNAPAGVNGAVIFPLPLGSPIDGNWAMDQASYDLLAAGSVYVNVHTQTFPGGEIRGQMIADIVGVETATFGAVKALFR